MDAMVFWSFCNVANIAWFQQRWQIQLLATEGYRTLYVKKQRLRFRNIYVLSSAFLGGYSLVPGRSVWYAVLRCGWLSASPMKVTSMIDITSVYLFFWLRFRCFHAL